jgi:hypothetical protein
VDRFCIRAHNWTAYRQGTAGIHLQRDFSAAVKGDGISCNFTAIDNVARLNATHLTCKTMLNLHGTECLDNGSFRGNRETQEVCVHPIFALGCALSS